LGRTEDITDAAGLVKELEVEVARLVEFCAKELGVE